MNDLVLCIGGPLDGQLVSRTIRCTEFTHVVPSVADPVTVPAAAGVAKELRVEYYLRHYDRNVTGAKLEMDVYVCNNRPEEQYRDMIYHLIKPASDREACQQYVQHIVDLKMNGRPASAGADLISLIAEFHYRKDFDGIDTLLQVLAERADTLNAAILGSAVVTSKRCGDQLKWRSEFITAIAPSVTQSIGAEEAERFFAKYQ